MVLLFTLSVAFSTAAITPLLSSLSNAFFLVLVMKFGVLHLEDLPLA